MLTSKIEKIAKKLSVFTADDISIILEEPDENIKAGFAELESKKLLKFNGNTYFYIEPIRPKPVRIRERTRSRKVCDINYQNYESNFIQQIIEYFCADVETAKASLLLNSSQNTIIGIYGDFRKKLYERQQSELSEKYFFAPKLPSAREYLGTTVYLYCYAKQIFVVTAHLKTENIAKIHTRKETSEIKKINCMLRRRFENSCNLHYVEHRASEYIWRKDKQYSELVQDLTKLVEKVI